MKIPKIKSEDNIHTPLLIGVTGTYGKTMVTHLIYHILRDSGKRAAYLSSISYFDGKNEDLDLNANNISRKELSDLFSRMLQNGIEIAVIEITSKNINKNLYKDLIIDTGIITNIIGDKQNYKTWDQYADTKLEFIKMIRDRGLLIMNGDDSDSVDWLKAKNSMLPQNIFVYWTLSSNISKETYSLNTTLLEIDQFMKVFVPIIGYYNKMNIFQAAKAATKYVPATQVQKSLGNFKAPKGRLDLAYTQPYLVYVDHSHTPLSLEDALSFLNNNKPKTSRIICVVGAKGNAHKDTRKLGEPAAKYSNLLVVTSNDPYHESVEEINNEIAENARLHGATLLERFAKADDFTLIDQQNLNNRMDYAMKNGEIPMVAFDTNDYTGRLDAIRFAIRQARPGDIVYIGGKGHELTTRYGDTEYEWSDYEAIKYALYEALRQ